MPLWFATQRRQFISFTTNTLYKDSMPRLVEEVLNAELGRLLISRHPVWSEENVIIDSAGTIRNNAGLKIDLLIHTSFNQPIAIEAKNAQSQSRLKTQIEKRMGLIVDATGQIIESGISIVYPEIVSSELESARLRYAVHQLDADGEIHRLPQTETEWLRGGVDDIANLIEITSLSLRRIKQAGQYLVEGVNDASAIVERDRQSHEFGENLARTLHQEEGLQTTRMAITIVVNAFVFHYALEGMSGIPFVAEARSNQGFVKSMVLKSWQSILDVNYWPIFSVAHEIVHALPNTTANRVLDKSDEVAVQLKEIGTTTFHDLAARVFQTLISDRKFLATFYTLPNTAFLLADFAVEMLDVDWGNPSAVRKLRIADFACGTGTLLSAVQQAIYRRLRRKGFNDGDFHQDLMEKVRLGADIMPSAAHISASMLSSAHPNVIYGDSLIRVLPYGRDEDLSKLQKRSLDSVYTGSLDFLNKEFGYAIFQDLGGTQMDIGGTGIHSLKRSVSTGREFPVGHNSFDLVIMNPPFTRPTNHKTTSVPVPSFAGFDTSDTEQRKMSAELRKHKALFGNGNAGLASNFMDLAHVKLKHGGVLALVLPFTFLSGDSWKKARDALVNEYSEIFVFSIVAVRAIDRAFSADTGMAECLVVARRGPTAASHNISFVNLPCRPKSLFEAYDQARSAENKGVVQGSFDEAGIAGVLDRDLINVLTQLKKGTLDLPRQFQKFAIPMTNMGSLADRGLYHLDIKGRRPRGAFDIKTPIKGVPAYPTLWNHNYENERSLLVEPDSYGRVREGMQVQADRIWRDTASRLHHNIEFGLSAQSLACCITPSPSIGGRAWPNILVHEAMYETPLLLWCNTTFGLMLHWWHGSRQHSGRSMVQLSKLQNLATLDVRQLDVQQLSEFDDLFNMVKDWRFLPANEAYRDENRHELDKRVMRILRLPEALLESMDLVRMKWCCEPSVHGGKKTKPSALNS